MRELAFEALCKLAARNGGERLFGSASALVAETFRKSLIGAAFPSFWMEAPLAGEPGFDLHVYYDRGQLRGDERFAEGSGFGMQGLFDWFFGDDVGGIGVGFAHDLRGGAVATGAYVNFNARPLADARGFFSALGVPEVGERADALLAALPEGWRPWYLGYFPGRGDDLVRVGAFVQPERQRAYADDARVLAGDLSRAGFDAVDGAMLGRLSALAALPFTLELQLDAGESGVGDTLGADLTLESRSAARVREAFAPGGDGAAACELLERWGVADGRWREIAGASHSKLVPALDDDGELALLLLSCLPAFVKAKWRAAVPQPAKVYFECSACPVSPAVG